MGESLGQIVYLFKDKLASEVTRTSCHTDPMPQRQPRPPLLRPVPATRLKWEAMDKDKFALVMGVRLAAARDKIELSQAEMAAELGLKLATYAKYESRSMMPANLLAKFSDVTGADLKGLLKDPR